MKPRFKFFFLFSLDLLIMNLTFAGVYIYYYGNTLVPIKYIFIPILTAFFWYFIASDLTVLPRNIFLSVFLTLKNNLIRYSILTSGVIFIVAIFGNFDKYHKLILWWLFFAAMFSSIMRGIFLITLKYLKKLSLKSVLLVGGDRVAEKVMNKILSSPSIDYHLYGVIADYYHETLPKQLYLGKLEKFSEIVTSKQIDHVIVALPLRREEQIIDIANKCDKEGIRVSIVPDFYRIIKNSPVIEKLDDIPLIGIRTILPDLLKNRVLKRTFDIVFSLTCLLTLLPLILLIALLVKCSSRGPVLFKQERVGANNVKFVIYKFRTMTVQDKKTSDTVWTTPNDSRITKMGKFLRKTNLDELPQFWNVLIGDMSVVGPRPERAYFVNQFKKGIPNYNVRHLIKSGITGLAQVNGFRGDTSISSRVEFDINYLENWSFLLDIKIIFMTVFGKKTHISSC